MINKHFEVTFPNSVCAANSGYNGTCYRWNFLICRHLHCDHHNLDRHCPLSMITLATMISSVMVIIAMATSTMVIITTIFVQFKRVLGQGRDGERLLCFVLWSLLCLQVGWGCVCLCVYLCLCRPLESAVSSGLKLLFRRNGQRNEGQFFLPKSFHVCANESVCTAACIKFGFGKSRNDKCSWSTVYLAGRPWVRTTPMPSSAPIPQGAKTIFIVILFWWICYQRWREKTRRYLLYTIYIYLL